MIRQCLCCKLSTTTTHRLITRGVGRVNKWCDLAKVFVIQKRKEKSWHCDLSRLAPSRMAS